VSNVEDDSKVLRVVFLLRNPGYFRNIEWLVKYLTEGVNYDVRVIIGGVENSLKVGDPASGEKKSKQKNRLMALNDLAVRYESVLFSIDYPKLPVDLAIGVQKNLLDILFFTQDVNINNKPARDRIRGNLSSGISRIVECQKIDTQKALRRHGERALVNSTIVSNGVRAAEKFLMSLDADVIAVMPCVGDESALLLGLACQNLGIPSIGLVASWDNLSIKGQYLNVFSRTICWSDFQIREIEEVHKILDVPSRAIAVGPYPFAHRSFALEKGPKHNERNLNKVRHVTWFMSSGFISTSGKVESLFSEELELIKEFLTEFSTRRSHNSVSWLLTIRLHPQNAKNSKYIDFLERVRDETSIDFVIDDSGEPIGDTGREAYTSLLARTNVFVGLATTALFEGALLGKPALIPPGKLAERSFFQLNHGRYLRSENGGPARVTRDWSQFFQDLNSPLTYTPEGEFLDWLNPRLHARTVEVAVNTLISSVHNSEWLNSLNSQPNESRRVRILWAALILAAKFGRSEDYFFWRRIRPLRKIFRKIFRVFKKIFRVFKKIFRVFKKFAKRFKVFIRKLEKYLARRFVKSLRKLKSIIRKFVVKKNH
jgi:hypothetical protein